MPTHLYEGAIETIQTDLADTPAAPKTRYFQTHQHHLNYEQTRLAGFPLGSRTVESGINQFKHRLSGPSMRRNLANIQQMAPYVALSLETLLMLYGMLPDVLNLKCTLSNLLIEILTSCFQTFRIQDCYTMY
jgi:hypothetical protein